MSAEHELKEKLTPSSTTLNLFRLTDRNYSQVADYYTTGVKSVLQVVVSNKAFYKLSLEMSIRKERLLDTMGELTHQSWARMDSATAGALYLKLYDELSEKGITPQDIFGLFRQCLILNTRCSDLLDKGTAGNTSFLRVLPILETARGSTRFTKEIYRIFDEGVKVKPPWFHGDDIAWRDFIQVHTPVAGYLENFHAIYPHIPEPLVPGETRKTFLRITSKENLPEWINEEEEEGIFTRTVVETELIADLEEQLQTGRVAGNAEKQYQYLLSTVHEKQLKGIRHLLEKRRQAFPIVTNFTQAVVFLGCSTFYPEFTVNPLDTPSASFKQVEDGYVSPEKAHETRIKTLVHTTEIYLGAESIALWIEKNLLEGNIIQSAQDVVDDNIINLIGLLFGELIEGRTNPDFQVLRETNKKAFGALNYEIRPFLAALEKNELEYLLELTRASKDTPLEPLIWEMADLITSKWQNREVNPALKHTVRALDHIQHFLSSWFRNHYLWATHKLYEGLVAKQKQMEEETTSIQHVEEAVTPQAVEEQTPSTEIQEIEEEIIKSQRGCLAGWHLYYTKNERLDPKEYVEIGSEQAAAVEREEQFTNYVRRNGLTCTINPASIIRSFEVIVSVPQEMEWIRKRMEVNGITFRKYDHPMGMRTLYVLKRPEKEIIFFIYKKKAWKYRF